MSTLSETEKILADNAMLRLEIAKRDEKIRELWGQVLEFRLIVGSKADDLEVADAYAKKVGSTLKALRRKNRQPPVVRQRAAVAAELRNLGWTLERIGSALNRDHAAISNLLTK